MVANFMTANGSDAEDDDIAGSAAY